jgi:hypothetical protein
MFRKLVKTTDIDIEGTRYVLCYFEQKTIRGGRRYSCEVLFDAADHIIIDDDSMMSLESKVARVAPAMLYSRVLAARPGVAA